MGMEIERKFVVPLSEHDCFLRRPGSSKIVQAYLSQDPDRTMRLRVCEDSIGAFRSYMTVKTRQVGMARSEWEFNIPLVSALEMMQHLNLPLITKKRHTFWESGNTWEVDVIVLGSRDPAKPHEARHLVLAEVEGPSEAYLSQLELPSWVGQDVTNDPTFAMSNLTDLAACEAAYQKAYAR